MGTAMLTVQADKIFLDPTGKVRGGKVLNEDRFLSGMNGWLQLYTPSQDGLHRFATLTRIFRGVPRIQLRTPNAIGVEGMGIKRMGNYYGEGRYLIEFIASIDECSLDSNRPRWYGWGFDVANTLGVRHYFYLKYTRFDESLVTETKKWTLQTSGGQLDLPGAAGSATQIEVNENKALPFYIALEVNTVTGKYLGVRIGDQMRYGSLAETPNDSLSSQAGPATESLLTFKGGMNPFFNVVNRSNNSSTGAATAVQYQRTTFLGA